MPSWPVHFAVAKEVNKIFNFDEDLFYYGNILPDVGNDFGINRDDAHYYGIPFNFCPKEEQIDLKRFLNDYRESLDNPLILGYYSHLLTDNYYNENIYIKCWILDKNNNIIGIKLKNGKIMNIPINDLKKEKRKYKHHDLELFGKYIFDKKIIPKDKEKICSNIKFIKKGYLTKEIVEDRFKEFNGSYIKNSKLPLIDKIFKYRYYLFTKEELDNMFNDCCKLVIKEIKEIKNIDL